MVLKIGLILGLTILSGILYRLGGAKGWNTKYRDFGCPLVGIITLLVLGVKAPWWAFFLLFGGYFGALTTYYDDAPFNWMKPRDNFWLHGLGCGLAFLWFPLATGCWLAYILHCILACALVGFWSEKTSWDILEEFGRGFILNTLILLYFFLK